MSKRLQVLVVVAVMIIVGAVLLRSRLNSTVSAAGSPGNASNAETSMIDRGDISLSVSATGSIQAAQNVSLTFSIPGKVTSLNVEEGDYVRKGQVIATLDNQAAMDNLLQAQARINAQQVALRQLTDKPRQVDINVLKAALSMAQAQLTEAQAGPDKTQDQIAQINVEIAKNQLWQTELQRDITNNTRKDLQKNSYTYSASLGLPSETVLNASVNASGSGVVVQEALLAAQNALGANVGSIAAAQGQITAAQNALDKLMEGGDKDDIAQAQARLQAANAVLEQGKAALAFTKLVAPFDGVIARLNLNLGSPTPAGPAVVMLDTSKFYVDLPVDEVDISKVSDGQAAKMTFDALPGTTLDGNVTRISQVASKSADSVVYTVRVEFNPAGQPLRATMSTTVTIVTSQINNTVRIRNRFVRMDRLAGKAYAMVRQPDGSYKEVEIVLGLRNDTYSEVKQGLAAGDTVTLPTNNNLPF